MPEIFALYLLAYSSPFFAFALAMCAAVWTMEGRDAQRINIHWLAQKRFIGAMFAAVCSACFTCLAFAVYL
jgi:hypothetical protein